MIFNIPLCLVLLFICSLTLFPFNKSIYAQHGVEENDYYAILELEKGEDSTDKDIKRQFRVLSKLYHPDHNPSESARARYQKIQRAHEVLGDRKKRTMYDLRGEEGVKQLETRNAGDPNAHANPFAAFFGGGGGASTKPQETTMTLQVSLEDVYTGRTHSVSLKKQKLCKRCKGSGGASKDSFAKCHACQGQGTVVQQVQFGPFIQHVQQQCSHCSGKGKIVTATCPMCRGRKVTHGTHTLEIDIERGIPNEHAILYEMEGDQHPDQIPGDIKFLIRTLPHARFTCKGNDLYTTITISLLESLIGFSHEVIHLDGHVVVVERENLVTPYGTVVVIEEEGMPYHNVPSEKGALHITIHVRFPSMIAANKREELKALLDEIGQGDIFF